MKLFKGIGTVIVLAVLIASLALALTAGPVRFLALNPSYLKTFMPTRSYCDELRARISDDLDHVALLYGLEAGALSDVVTDESIRAYTSAMIDALFAEETKTEMHLPDYPAEGFAEYLRTHTAYSEKAIKDFSEDCAAAVTEDLSAINATLLVGKFTTLRDGLLAKASPLLFGAGIVLALLMCVIIKLMYTGKSRRAGSVVLWGGCFMGVTVVFVPVMQFLLFDYVGRLNVSISAFRTILTGMLYTILYGWFLILLALFALCTLMLIIAIVRASRKKRTRKAQNNA